MSLHWQWMDQKADCFTHKGDALIPHWGIHQTDIPEHAWGLENKQRPSSACASRQGSQHGEEDEARGTHISQLVVNDGLSSQRSVTDIIAMLKKFAIHFHHLNLAKQRLRAILKDLGQPEHYLIQAVPTGWNSKLHVLQRVLEQEHALNVYSGEQGGFTCPTAYQWDIVSNLVTLEVSHNNSSASCVIDFVWLCWRCYFKVMKGPETQGIRTLRQVIREKPDQTFLKTRRNKNCSVSMSLRSSNTESCILLWCYINKSQRMAERGCGRCHTRDQSGRASGYRGSKCGRAGGCRCKGEGEGYLHYPLCFTDVPMRETKATKRRDILWWDVQFSARTPHSWAVGQCLPWGWVTSVLQGAGFKWRHLYEMAAFVSRIFCLISESWEEVETCSPSLYSLEPDIFISLKLCMQS